jgi:hypothetical protein
MRAAVRLLCQVLQRHQAVIRFFGQTQHVSLEAPIPKNVVKCRQ